MIKPLGVHVLVEPYVKKSLIKVAGTAQQEAERGTVLAIGEDVSTTIAEGDEVIFRKYSPEPFDVDGEKFYIVEVQDIMGIIKK